eukprot:TCONS_00056428-protein
MISIATKKLIFKLFCFSILVVTVACFIGLVTNNLGFGFFFACLTLVSAAMLYMVVKWKCIGGDKCWSHSKPDSLYMDQEPDIESRSSVFTTVHRHQTDNFHHSTRTLATIRPFTSLRGLFTTSSTDDLNHRPDEPSPLTTLRGGVMSDTNLFIGNPPPYSTFDGTLPSYDQLEQTDRCRSESAVQTFRVNAIH